jgi:signal transduction histidine kinase
MRAKVLALSAVHAAAVAGLGGAAWRATDEAWSVTGTVAFAAAYALAGLTTTHLELRRHAFSLSAQEGVLVVALLTLSPPAVVVAVGIGELLACLRDRLGLLKVTFNVSQSMSATALAAWVMATGGHSDPAGRPTWLYVGLAVTAFFVVNVVSVAGIVAVVEGRRIRHVLLATAGPAFVTTAASGSLGLLVVVLGHHDQMAPLLIVPLFLVLLLASHGLAAQRSERMRFQRLYEASGRTSTLMGLDEVLATLADESRSLVTGSSAMCCTRGRDGRWVGALVGDDRRGPADQDTVDAVVALSQVHGTAHVDSSTLAPALRQRLPRAASVVVADTPTAVLAVFRDLDDDEQGSQRAEVLAAFAAHAALAVANAQLYADVEDALQRQIDLNRQKGEFVASVSHELRTPLTGVLTSVATMRRLRDSLTDEQHARLFDVAQTSGERLRRLIDELLLVASAEHGGASLALRPVDLTALFGEVEAELAKAAGGRLHVAVGPGLDAVTTDAEKLRRIVTNLVENALKYAPDGPVRLRAERRDELVVVAVADEGPGIPEADRERVFERFVQLDQSSTRRAGGTGLGLYLCRQLAVALGGTVELADAPGGGACFTVTLPASAGAVVGEPGEAPATAGTGTDDLDADYVTGGVA